MYQYICISICIFQATFNGNKASRASQNLINQLRNGSTIIPEEYEKKENLHAVLAALRQYLLELPEPLCGNSFDLWLEAGTLVDYGDLCLKRF